MHIYIYIYIYIYIKKGKNFLFDVTMESHDGAETCELVGLYFLNRLSTVILLIKVETMGLLQ